MKIKIQNYFTIDLKWKKSKNYTKVVLGIEYKNVKQVQVQLG